MFCKNCGNKINSNSRFCEKCGCKIADDQFFSKMIYNYKLFKYKKSVLLTAFLISLISILWANLDIFRWIHVPVDGDKYREFYYERKLIFPQDYLHDIKILINLNDRNNLNELSYVLEASINCLTDRGEIIETKSFFKKNGSGDLLHVTKGFSYLGPGIAAVRKEICNKGLRNVSSQPKRLLNYNELNIHLGSFLQCKTNFELRKKLLMYVNPNERKDSYWAYNTTGIAVDNFGNYAKLPVKQILFGVCDKSGDLGCGNSMFTALIFDMPKDEVRKNLLTHRNQGIDFTVEHRDQESKITLRSHLADYGNNKSESILYCDSGNL